MHTDLLVATTNPGKLREIRLILDGLPLRIRSLGDFPPVPEPDENASTFVENGRLKAEAYARATGWPTVAEDSGLAIDALDGRPGVLSARYPGDTYPEKFANLYRELAPHPQPWTARYVCALTYVDPAAAPAIQFEVQATVEGEITDTPQGSHGFGYDPIFYYRPYETTLGNVDDARKLVVAHRGKAFRAFRAWLERTSGSASSLVHPPA
jgi:XTP/dITP diphosphohydrolase